MALGNIFEPLVFLSAPPIRGRSRIYFKIFVPSVVNGVFSASMKYFSSGFRILHVEDKLRLVHMLVLCGLGKTRRGGIPPNPPIYTEFTRRGFVMVKIYFSLLNVFMFRKKLFQLKIIYGSFLGFWSSGLNLSE